MAKKPLREQVLVVTGASSGLGRAIARLAGERGAKVVVTARNEDALANCVAEVERAGSEALAVSGDVTDQAQVERVVAEAVERFGRIDTYVANAIVTVYAEAERLEPEELRRVWEVNFFGVVYGYWAALPHLRESRGTFLHVSSALAYRGTGRGAAGGLRRGDLARPPGGDQHAAIRPRPAEDRLPAAAGAADLPARAGRGGDAALRRAPRPRAADLVGRAEAPLGAEALATSRRLGAPQERLEGPAHRRAEAPRRARQPVRYAAGRPGRAWTLRSARARIDHLDTPSAAGPEGLN
jgi:NAD(P)-dependent dehydrogenase (short-subunit alcohol dehydrogenase family)